MEPQCGGSCGGAGRDLDEAAADELDEATSAERIVATARVSRLRGLPLRVLPLAARSSLPRPAPCTRHRAAHHHDQRPAGRDLQRHRRQAASPDHRAHPGLSTRNARPQALRPSPRAWTHGTHPKNARAGHPCNHQLRNSGLTNRDQRGGVCDRPRIGRVVTTAAGARLGLLGGRSGEAAA